MDTTIYEVKITGKTPLLMHWDNIDWSDEMDTWRNDPNNKKKSKAGDDRTPAWRWIGCVYHNDKIVVMPTDNISRCMMDASGMVPVPGAKGNKTFRSQSQSGMMLGEADWPLFVDGKEIPISLLKQLRANDNFKEHREICAKHGFALFTKRAKIGMTKHIRVRPRFDNWMTRGSVIVTDEQITEDVLKTILQYAGRYKGLGDWRPGGKTPGPHGMFDAEVKRLS